MEVTVAPDLLNGRRIFPFVLVDPAPDALIALEKSKLINPVHK